MIGNYHKYSALRSKATQKCQQTFEMVYLPKRRKFHTLKVLIIITITSLLFTSLYYQYFCAAPQASNLHSLRLTANNTNSRYTPTIPAASQKIHSDDFIFPSYVVKHQDLPTSDRESSSSQIFISNNSSHNISDHNDLKTRVRVGELPSLLSFESSKLLYKKIAANKNAALQSQNVSTKVYQRTLEKHDNFHNITSQHPFFRHHSDIFIFGELGRPVVLHNLTKDEQKLVDEGWEHNAFNQYVSDLISVNRTLPDVRDDNCKSIQYPPLETLPSTSIIICFHNEAWSVLLRTVHSALNNSPKGLIKEIILVDDFSDQAHLGQQLDDYMQALGVVKIVRAESREGLIRARLLGAKSASSSVLTFLDSHCECAEGWLEPLLARIKEDPTAVVCPVIDVISDKTFEYHYKKDANAVSVGGFDWNLQFNWHSIPERERKRRKHAWDPIRSPTMAGGLFSIDKKFFEKLGTYDPGFDIWGGENLELSFKTWMCGGTLEIVPCSHVGHVFRSRSPYKWRKGVNVLKRNSIRLAEVWMDEYKKYYFDRIGHELGDYGDVSERLKLRKDLNCKPFSYYVTEIYPELFIPGEAVAYGDIKSEAGGTKPKMCLDSSAKKSDYNKPVGVYPCHGSGGNQYWLFSKDGEIRRDEACLDYAGKDVMLFPCHGSKGNQLWRYNEKSKLLKHKTSGRCLELDYDKSLLKISQCDGQNSQQRWSFNHYNATKETVDDVESDF